MVKILVVEDENIIRKGLIGTIDWLSAGFVVAGEAINGKDGLEKIEKIKPDLVITDIRMPVMDGLEMLRKAEEKSFKFEKILLTSYGEFEYAQEGIKLGVIDYILKPIDEDIFYKALEKAKEKIKRREALETVKNISEDDTELEFFNPKIFLGKDKNIYVDKAIEKIISSYAEKLNIKDIAEELDISASYLSRKFKDVTGETFLDVLNKYRIQKSIKLLQKQEYKIYEISEKVGFTDYKHFCNVFKKYLHAAPGDFAKKNVVVIK